MLKSLIALSGSVTDGASIWQTIPGLSRASNLAAGGEAIRLVLAMPPNTESREKAGALHAFR